MATKKEHIQKVYKGSVEFEHHLFKLGLSHFLKNISYKFMRPEIQRVEHVHFYHSVTTAGKTMKYCSAVGGHFHLMDLVLENGEIKSIKCGPPLTEKKIKIPGSMNSVKKIVPVKYEAIDVDTGDRKDIVDTHVHEINYVYTEHINPIAKKKLIQAEKEKIQGMVDSSRLAEQSANYVALQRGEYTNKKGSSNG
jgi:hypothetical protein